MDSELKGWLWIAFVIALIMVASDNDYSAADIREACDKNYRG